MTTPITKMSPQQIYTAGMALLTFVISQLVAYVPNLGTDKQNLISAGGAVLSAALAVSGSIHHLATKSSTPAPRPLVVTSTADAEATLRAQVISAGMTPEA